MCENKLYNCDIDEKIDVNSMRDFINAAKSVHREVRRLCDIICDSHPSTQIKGKIESLAFELAHHPMILNSDTLEDQE